MKEKLRKLKFLIKELNECSDNYYNKGVSPLTDEVYDIKLEELKVLEEETGCIFPDSPTQKVGYQAVDSLNKIKHGVPLLSLDKTKSISDLIDFIGTQKSLLMLKLDGLTIELVYDKGNFLSAATRGNGIIGSDISHNISAFKNIPLKINYNDRLVVTGECIIYTKDFENMKTIYKDSDGNTYKTARNLAAGSVKLLNANECKKRNLNFIAFKVIEGFSEIESRADKLNKLAEQGFDICNFNTINLENINKSELEIKIKKLKSIAERKSVPIDGMVISYDDLNYSKSCGRTNKFYKDSIAYKFKDDLFQTCILSIKWQTGKTGVVTPVAILKPIIIDGTEITKATLNNISFIKKKKIKPGCRVLISKRNMIIPYIEENLDMNKGIAEIPDICPCCGKKTEIKTSIGENNKEIEVLYCTNDNCIARNISYLTYFVSKDVMNIDGLSEGKLEKLIDIGIISNAVDIYHIDRYKDNIVAMEGFGELSYQKLVTAVNNSRNVTFDKFLSALNIKNLGKTAAEKISGFFNENIEEFEQAVYDRFQFNTIDGIGLVLNYNIYNWFTVTDKYGIVSDNSSNWNYWYNLKDELKFVKLYNNKVNKINVIYGKIIVITGTLRNFTRESIIGKIKKLGGEVRSSVTGKTDFLIVGEKPGSKFNAAKEKGIKIIMEEEFMSMI